METKVKAIVLGGIDYKEKDKLIKLFTLEQGIVTVVFRGVKNANAKLKSAKEVFSFGDFILTNGKFNIVTSADIIDSFFDITKDIKKYYIACAIIDIIKTVLPEGETNSNIFILTLKCLEMLAYQNVNIYNVINKFLLEVFSIIGYRFNVDFCNNCGEKLIVNRYLNLETGEITCANCKLNSSTLLSQITYSAIRLLSITNTDKISTLKINEDTNKQLFNLLATIYKNRFKKNISIL